LPAVELIGALLSVRPILQLQAFQRSPVELIGKLIVQ
jgi:hypothetical protein